MLADVTPAPLLVLAIFAPNLGDVRMQVVEVGQNAGYQKEFILFPVRLYQNDSCWIRPLDTDVAEVFDPVRNKRFENGEENGVNEPAISLRKR